MSSLVFICTPVKSRMGACGVYSIKKCKRTSPGCNGSAAKNVGSAASAWLAFGVLLFAPWNQTAILEGSLLVK